MKSFTGIYFIYIYIYVFIYIGRERRGELFEGKRLETEKGDCKCFRGFILVFWLGFEEGMLGERERRGEKKNIVAQEVNIYKGRSKKKEFVCLFVSLAFLALPTHKVSNKMET